MAKQGVYKRTFRAVLATAAAGLGAAAAEPRMAVKPRVELYRDDRPVATLQRDEIVPTAPHATDPAWLRVEWQAAVYDAHKDNLRTEWELRGALRVEQSQQRHTVRRLVDQLEDRLLSQLDLHLAIAWARYDGTIRYRIPVRAETGTGSAAGARAVTAYRTVRKISQSRVRSLVRDWQKDLKEHAESARRDRDQLHELAVAEAGNAVAEWRLATVFRRYRRDPDRYRIEPAVASADRADLYHAQRLVATLQRGQIVLAAPHVREPEWLIVYDAGQRYSSRTANFRTRFEIEEEVARENAALSQQLDALARENAELRERTRFLDLLRLDLQRGAALAPTRRAWKRSPRRAWIHRELRAEFVPTEAGLEEIDTSAARRLIDDWDTELDDIAARQQRNDKSMLRARQRLAELEGFLIRLRQEFAALGYTGAPAVNTLRH